MEDVKYKEFIEFLKKKNYHFNLPSEGGSYGPSIDTVVKQFEKQ